MSKKKESPSQRWHTGTGRGNDVVIIPFAYFSIGVMSLQELFHRMQTLFLAMAQEVAE